MPLGRVAWRSLQLSLHSNVARDTCYFKKTCPPCFRAYRTKITGVLTTMESTSDKIEAVQYSSGAETKLKEENTMICSMLVKVPNEKDESSILLKPRDAIDISNSTRTSWVNGMKRFVESGPEHQRVRPLDFLFLLDGSVEVRSPNLICSNLLPNTYPAAYRIPPGTVADLEPNEKVRRAELFALGSMIYEIYAGEAPFESLKDSDAQARYRCAQYPKVTHLPHWPMILSCWSVEFARELYAILSKQLLTPYYRY